MTKDDIINMIKFLKDKVNVRRDEPDNKVIVSFKSPTQEEMLNAGINPEAISASLQSSWWEEMITDIIETPDFCDPEAGEDEILEYARDTVYEYVGKRLGSVKEDEK